MIENVVGGVWDGGKKGWAGWWFRVMDRVQLRGL